MTGKNFISDTDIEKALDWLRDNASAIGNAKANQVRTEKMLSHIKALEMKKHELAVSAQEREAYASEPYKKAIEAAAVAAGEYEKMKALHEAASLKIDAWRSMSANYRSMKIG
jgi:hypothetical protein